jgi:hypothetical protein
MRTRVRALRVLIVLASLAAIAATCACGHRRSNEIGPTPERARSSTPPPTPPAPIDSTVVDGLVGYAGEHVTIEGKIVAPKQEHIEQSMPDKHAYVVELRSGGEVVVYFATIPSCVGVRASGKAFVIRGYTPKTHAVYAEVALDADEFNCR